MRPKKIEGSTTDTWAGKVNAIVKRVDALDRNVDVQLTEVKDEMGERFGGADQKMVKEFSDMDQKLSEIDEKMSALETKMDANVDKILGAIGLLGHSV